MSNLESVISNRRSKYARRRNLIRKLFLVLFLAVFIWLFYLLQLKASTATTRIDILGNKLALSSCIQDLVLREINHSSFFLLSQKAISLKLINSIPLFRSVVVRKYLIPENKYLVVVKEKNIWAKLLFYKDDFENVLSSAFLSEDGDVLSKDCLDLNLLSSELPLVYCDKNSLFQKPKFFILKNLFNDLKKINLPIEKFVINSTLDLDVYTSDGFCVHVGRIDQDLQSKLAKLYDLLNVIGRNTFMIQYLDLTLEKSAILKTYSGSNAGKSKEKDSKVSKGLFSKLMLN